MRSCPAVFVPSEFSTTSRTLKVFVLRVRLECHEVDLAFPLAFRVRIDFSHEPPGPLLRNRTSISGTLILIRMVVHIHQLGHGIAPLHELAGIHMELVHPPGYG